MTRRALAHHETPYERHKPEALGVLRRRCPWLAEDEHTGRDGKRRSAGTYRRKHEAQDAIDAAHDAEASGAPETVGPYAATWTDRHPRGRRTNLTNAGRIRQVLDVELEGRRLRDWPFRELKRRHALGLVTHMLTAQGRATGGVQDVLRTLSALAEDAITDEVADVNFVRGVRGALERSPRHQARARTPGAEL